MPHDQLQRAQVVSADKTTGDISVTMPGYSGGAIYSVSKIERSASLGVWDVPAVGSTIWVYIADERSHEVVWLGASNRFNSMPFARGVVAVGTATTNPVAVSTTANPGHLLASVTYTMELGRRYRVHFIMRALIPVSTSASGILYLCDSVTTADYFPGTNDVHVQVAASNGYTNVHCHWLISGAGVAHTFQVRMIRNIANLTAYPTQFYVEDVGPG